MIATILKSTPTFHAVLYNERKVAQGQATLMEIKNFGDIDTLGYDKPEQLQQYLIDYTTSRNDRIKNAQFHLAISCKGHDWTEQQLLRFAHDYLNEMGYGNPEQPLLVYAHHDTDNTHIHIITSRIAPNGKKINDSKERVRSQKAIDKLLGKNIREKTEVDVREALTYNFTSMPMFKSVLAAMGYESFEKDGKLCVKKGGNVQMKIPKEEILKAAEKNKYNRQTDSEEIMRWRAILKKYRDQNSNRQELERDLRSMFGVSLVWLGKKDDPFGYHLVDFSKKKVYDGYRILNIKQLTDFMTKEEHIKEIQVLIDRCLVYNPYITTKDLNSKMKRLGGYVRKDCFRYGSDKVPLDDKIRQTLDRNNKLAWRQSFKPASEAERDFICRLANYAHPELVKINPQPEGRYKPKEITELFDILSKNREEKVSAFRDAGYRMIKTEEGTFAVNFDSHVLIDMSRTGFPEALYSDLVRTPNNQSHNSSYAQKRNNQSSQTQSQVRKLIGGQYATGSVNREWEVGKRDYDRDDPDKNMQKGY